VYCCRRRGSTVFFFQAEDGIRDRNVTGVQTCALPISQAEVGMMSKFGEVRPATSASCAGGARLSLITENLPAQSISCAYSKELRSEERRVGKERGWKRER